MTTVTVKVWDEASRKFRYRPEPIENVERGDYIRSSISGYYYSMCHTIPVIGIDGTLKYVGEDELHLTQFCDGCEKRFIKGEMQFFNTRLYTNPVCQNCHSNIITCNCGTQMFANSYCSICDKIASYHQDNIRNKWPAPKRGDWGLEIEFVSKDKRRIVRVARKNNWAAEKDGSLGEDGVEIISPPMRYEDLMESVTKIMSEIQEVKVKECSYAGMHVSFHAGGIPRIRLAKFIEFITVNPNGICEKVSRRKEINRYFSYDNTMRIKIEEKIDRDTLNSMLEDRGKYQAINLSKLPRVEVRIFKSTQSIKEVKQALQFVRAVKEMCGCISPHKETSPTDDGTGKAIVSYRSTAQDSDTMVKEFFEFIRFKPEYKELRKLFNERTK